MVCEWHLRKAVSLKKKKKQRYAKYKYLLCFIYNSEKLGKSLNAFHMSYH